MKILFLSKSNHVDYLCDCLFIGLRELFGDSVVDINPMTHIYTDYPAAAVGGLYGKGMTVTRVLDNITVDRDDILRKIKTQYFDLIVYGSIHRYSEYLNEVLAVYPRNRVIIVDGEDETHIHQSFDSGATYFKRELVYKHERLLPITFALPTRHVYESINEKERNISLINPLDRSTYIHDSESTYYDDYRKSKFAITLKKAGWDCMRHYEIMGNGCVPLFLDIDHCPEDIMTPFPKDILSKVVNAFNIKYVRDPDYIKRVVDSVTISDYERLQQIVFKTLKEKLTTIAVARDFIDRASKI